MAEISQIINLTNQFLKVKIKVVITSANVNVNFKCLIKCPIFIKYVYNMVDGHVMDMQMGWKQSSKKLVIIDNRQIKIPVPHFLVILQGFLLNFKIKNHLEKSWLVRNFSLMSLNCPTYLQTGIQPLVVSYMVNKFRFLEV